MVVDCDLNSMKKEKVIPAFAEAGAKKAIAKRTVREVRMEERLRRKKRMLEIGVASKFKLRSEHFKNEHIGLYTFCSHL